MDIVYFSPDTSIIPPPTPYPSKIADDPPFDKNIEVVIREALRVGKRVIPIKLRKESKENAGMER